MAPLTYKLARWAAEHAPLEHQALLALGLVNHLNVAEEGRVRVYPGRETVRSERTDVEVVRSERDLSTSERGDCASPPTRGAPPPSPTEGWLVGVEEMLGEIRGERGPEGTVELDPRVLLSFCRYLLSSAGTADGVYLRALERQILRDWAASIAPELALPNA